MRALVLLAVVGLGIGCGPPPEATVPSPAASSSTAPSSGSLSTQPPPSQPPGSPLPVGEPPSSEALIAQALAEGKIDYETSLIYRAYGLYNDARLPAEYRSPVIDYEAGSLLAKEVLLGGDAISASTLEALRPFLARPNDPVSVFNTAPVGGSEPAGLSAALIAGRQADRARVAGGALLPWKSDLAAGGAARVWAKVASTEEETFGFEALIQIVDQVWEQLPKFIDEPNPDDGSDNPTELNPDSAIDIYFVDFTFVDKRLAGCDTDPSSSLCHLVGGALGQTKLDGPLEEPNGSGSSAYVLVHRNLTGNWLKGTIAHEVFHAAQFSYDYLESQWLHEATATWGEFRILQELGVPLESVHSELPDAFKSIEQPLTSTVDNHAYPAYLFFVFTQMERDDRFVAHVWEQAAAPGEQGIGAVDALLPLQDSFPDFALRTWNHDPTEPRYRDVDSTFPDLRPPFGGLPLTGDSAVQPVELLDEIQPLAITYWHFDFPSEAVHSVVINNTLAGDPQRAVQAYVRIGSTWEPQARDWTQEGEIRFCRDLPEQAVQELVIVISNSDAENPFAPAQKPFLEARTRGCAAWTGTVTSTWHHLTESQGYLEDTTLTRTATVSWDIDLLAAVDANNADVFEPVDGSVTWELHGTMTAPDTTCTQSGSGSYAMRDLDVSDLNYHGRDAYLVTWTDAAGNDLYGAHGLAMSQGVTFTGTLSCTASGVSFSQEVPVELAGAWLSTGANPPFDGLPIADDGHIRGEYTDDNPPLGETSTWKWDFAPTGGQ